MASFKEAWEETSAVEGGYVDDDDDRGGETYRGVARNFHPRWPGWDRIDAAKDDPGFPGILDEDESLDAEVAAFYRTHFWNRLKGNQIANQAIAEELFDTAVNMGVGRAGRFLQESLNMLNRDGDLYPEIGEDGLIGSVTLGTLEQLLATRDGDRHLHDLLNILQGMQYVSILRNNASQRKFIRGWLRRVSV